MISLNSFFTEYFFQIREGFTKKYIEVYMCNGEISRIFIMTDIHNTFISINMIYT